MNLLKTNKKIDTELNLTPLIDIVFLLLIFFMISTKFDTNPKKDIDLPISNYPQSKIRDDVSIFVDVNNIVTIRQKKIPLEDFKKIRDELENLKNSGLSQLTIYADSRVNYQSFIRLMSSVSSAKIKRVSFSVKQSK